MTAIQDIRLVVRYGPRQGHTYLVLEDSIVIGRSADADFVIPFPAVSSRHARVWRDAGRWFIEDLQSRNGTLLNDQQLEGQQPLRDGDSIKLGQSVILEFVNPPPLNMTVVESPPAAAATGDQFRTVVEPPAPDRPPVYAAATEIGFLPQDLDAYELPRLQITVAGEAPQTHRLIRSETTIGRSPQNHIVIDSPNIAPQLARVTRDGDGFLISMLPEVTNPVLYQGRPLSEPHRLRHDDKFRVGCTSPGRMVTFIYQSQTEVRDVDADIIDFEGRSKLTIGRDPSNDVQLDDPVVSRYHAQIERIGQRFRLTDLRSSNGTFVNHQAVEGEQWLQANDVLRIGHFRFVVGKDSLVQHDDGSNLRIEAIGLNKWVRQDFNILQDISLVLQPCEFIVVVGQSGGGKSTLVDATAGYRPATQGEVRVNDINIYENFDAVRHLIGFVPQRDIIHMELSVYQALDYAARLRMPPDTSEAERHQRIMEVLEDLDLAHRQDVQISGLSGGQQKRVSIGVELLTKPGLFYLDEPTSGLDPGTETALMQLMRRLADQGRTITLVTHATKNVMLADKVAFLARGGYLVWFGPPDEALAYFDEYRLERDRRARKMEFDDIYAILDDAQQGTPQEWAERFRQHQAFEKYIAEPLQRPEPSPSRQPTAAEPAAAKTSRSISGWHQFLSLSGRNIKILTRDRSSLGLMLATAPLVSLLSVILAAVLGRDPFEFNGGEIRSVLITYFLLTLYGVMVGGLSQMREIVKEKDIYRRERLVNLKILPYVLSKIWMAALLALYHALVYTVVHFLAFRVPGGVLEFGLIYMTMLLATMAGMMLGLFASALSPTSSAAPLIVILLMLPQIVLGGVLVPMSPMISGVTSTHWAFAGLMATLGFGNDIVNDPCWTVTAAQLEMMSNEQKDANCRCRGSNTVRSLSCNMPGLGQFYTPAIDEPRPLEPEPLPPEPARPTTPPQPAKPADETDAALMSAYLDDLQAWQTEMETIQTTFEADIAAYRAQAEQYQSKLIAYQSDFATWQIERTSASVAAEALLENLAQDVFWSFTDKENTAAWWGKITRSWGAQLLIIAVLFVGILALQKRKDLS